ncbi:MAG TPA: arginine--tRNA ligase [Synergistales bacterium]|nr:arginine--tRNA ligase [Synergistales bacterium]
MDQIKATITGYLQKVSEEITRDLGFTGSDFPEIALERPKREGHGDFSTNLAMQFAGKLGKKPRILAQEIVDLIPKDPHIEKIEIAGPGFINFFLSSLWIRDMIDEIYDKGERYGSSDLGGGRAVQVEFVSANPTGPLHVGHGRGAAVGDTVSNILSYTGWKVGREYYINDAGLQMDILGRSTQSRYFELAGRAEECPFPEDGYKGDYIYDLAREVMDRDGMKYLDMDMESSLPAFRSYASDRILGTIRKDLQDFGVPFDNWFSEKSLYEEGLVDHMVSFLKEKDYAYEQDGAVWFRATAFDDEKDRVLIRNNGVPTYFASDVAYHKNKFERGFSKLIDVWGADHHGYIPRVKAAISSLGHDPEEDFQVLLIQFVNLLREGDQVSMSTRSGQFITLRDVFEEVGVDATRYFFVMRRSDSHLDFDLELAKKESTDNPVYYVQYAHARMCSVLSEAESRGIVFPDLASFREDLMESPEEKKLVSRLAVFKEELGRSSEELAPHILVNYVHDLAGDFHSFYNAKRILGEEEDIMETRLILLKACKIVVGICLALLRINAPERM